MSGIDPDTALGRMVSIRSENDKDMLKHFTPDQKRIRAKWLAKRAKNKTGNETNAFIEQMKQSLIKMAKGGDG